MINSEPLEALVVSLAEIVALSLELVTILVLVIGAAQALLGVARAISDPGRAGWMRAVFLRFAGWTVLSLEFALAADIVRTTNAPTWDEIGKLALIAAVRTALNFFLERDIEALKGEEKETRADG